MVMLAVNFTACSDDEDEQTIIEQANLIGKWQTTWEKIHKVENDKEIVTSDEAYTNGLWEFKADGTCTEGYADGGYTETSRWSLKDNKLTISYDDGYSDVLTVNELTATKLVLAFEDWDTMDDGSEELDKTKRASSKQTNLKGSQYIAALHRDSKSGILHLHIDANRVDMEGRINDSHKIGERAVMAANIINERRGWMQSEEIGIRHRQEISVCCMEILRKMDKFSWKQYEAELTKRGYKVHLQEKESGGVYGYSIKRGNSIYKSSVLGIGRSLTPSKIEATWAKLHPQERKSEPTKPISQQTRTADITPISQPVIKHYNIATDEYHSYHVEIPEAADNIIRQNCSLEEAHPLAKLEEIQHTALLLFAGYLDAATSMATSSGGGSDTGGWGRDKDEDELEWARRCARMANSMCKRRKGLHR